MSSPHELLPKGEQRLESWKEIAAYLGKSVRTVIRWEKTEGLPIHRHQHEKKSSVYAHQAEVDLWWEGRRAALEGVSPSASVSVQPTTRKPWVVLALVSAVGVLAILWLPRSKQPVLPRLRFEVLTSYAGDQVLPTLSPDGSQFAFTWTGLTSRNSDIYVQTIGSTEPRRLTDDPKMDFGPAWSPDGKWIAFLQRDVTFSTRVFLIPALGGPPRKLADLALGQFLDATQIGWSPDGKWLALPETQDEKQGLFLLSVASGEKRRVTTSSNRRGHMDPVFSPDGRHLAFRCKNLEYSSEICTVELDRDLRPKGDVEILTSLGVRSTSPAWTADGQWLIFSSGAFLADSGIYKLRVFPKSQRSQGVETVLTPAADQYGLAVGRRTNLLVYTRRQNDDNLWQMRREGGVWKPASLLTGLASNRIERSPDLSPDGKTLAFASNRSGTMEVWTSKLDGADLRQLTSFGSEGVSEIRWSPDGGRIAVITGSNSGLLYVVDSAGSLVRKVTTDAEEACWSPDGEWIYFRHGLSGRPGLFKIRADGGREIQVSETEADKPGFSRDSAFFYSLRREGLYRQSIGAPATERLVIPGAFWTFAPGRDGVFTISAGPWDHTLAFHPLHGGQAMNLITTKYPKSSFTVSGDGNTVIFPRIERQESNIMLIRDF